MSRLGSDHSDKSDPLNTPIGDTGGHQNEKGPEKSGPFSIFGGDGQN